MISPNTGPKRRWDEKENILMYGNKRIRRTGDSRSNSSSSRHIPYETTNISLDPGHSPWLPLPPPVSKEPMTRCIEVQKEYDPMHMFRPSKRIHGSQNGSYDRNSLPAGWLDCPPYGDALGVVIPSKVPLRESFKDKIVINKRYSPQQAILQQRRLGRELGLVIDLTNTDRYCWKSDWTKEGIEYVKIRCAGKDSVPDQDNGFQENQVTNVVGKDDTINVVGAGEMANAVGEDEMENVTVPSEMTNDDILGDAVPLNKMESMRQFCNKVLKPKSQGQFPGSQPVSLSRDNLQLLRQQYYYTTWKADGTRYMMLITRDGCYLIDRKFVFRSVNLRFPHVNANEGVAGNTDNYTLLDGEMVIDTDKHTQERRYLVYDMIAINGESLVDQPFSSRWARIENEVIKPRNTEREILKMSSNPYYRYDLELFGVRRKNFYQLSAVPKLLKKFIPRLSHASDGLIFQPWDDRYVSLRHVGLLKWKYPEMNSVDFLLEVGNNNHPMLYLYKSGEKKLLSGSRGVIRDPSPSVDIFSLSGKIIEWSWDYKENEWVFMRTRPDKSEPNAFSTYLKVMSSIKDKITEADVISEIQDIIHLPMYAARMKADCKTSEKNG